MRSLLFVPGDSQRKLEKGFASGADVLLIDLEDSVSQENKAEARQITRSFLDACKEKEGPRLFVRVNALDTQLTDGDLQAIMGAQPEAVMLPKACGMASLSEFSVMLRVAEAQANVTDGATRIIAIITETAASVLATPSWNAPHPRLAGLSWGAEDLSADIGALATRDANGAYTDVFRLARAVTLLSANACQTAAIDTVFVDYRDESGLRRECEAALRDGFTGKMAIHPAQVPIINDVFTPSKDAIAQALRIVDAFAQAGNRGVVGIEGKMYDRPHLRRAERLLDRAQSFQRGR
ncbi:HpcH/HpaI aldolase/citrate lyase family protein [Limoniibacter endophyticus]|uniref:Citryl-CoA lyase n=1 Tax=Limoniibacter endophyticus TaxID=1565040 RepID=A0A8J3DF66_9HYPH|nr:CoA ester lyase [Limoniibacter endophyticus]GHC60185.1 citryl-CoA lyase [Limoniibacter endophyticus]